MDEASFLGTNKLVREQLCTVAGCSTLVELLHKSLSVQQVGGVGHGIAGSGIRSVLAAAMGRPAAA